MVTCSCGRKIEKIPSWLNGVKVDFVCNNCPNRQHKNIAVISAEIDKANAAATARAAGGGEDEDDVEELDGDEE